MKMKQLLLATLLLVVFSGCEDDLAPVAPEPASKYAVLSVLGGNGQTGLRAAVLQDSLTMQVTTDHDQLSLDKFYLKVSMVEGNGIVTGDSRWGREEILFPDASGIFKAAWKLGCDETRQSVEFSLFYADSCNWMSKLQEICTPIDTVLISATAFLESASWLKICGIDRVDAYHTRIRTFGAEIYAVSFGKLYRLKDEEPKYWEELPNLPDRIYDFGFNSQGTLYALTHEKGIFVTDDQIHWKSYGTGILDPRYPVGFLVEDSVVYASFSFDGMYRIRKNSLFARKLLVAGKYHEQYDFPVRHPNGDLYIVDKWDTYWKSSDSGDMWAAVPIGWKYVHSETMDFKIHPSGFLYIGSGDASLAILSPDTYEGDFYKYYQSNGASQHIQNIQFDGNDVYYLVCYTPDAGIYSSTTGWKKIDLGFDRGISIFHRMKDGSFLLGTGDGLYYKVR